MTTLADGREVPTASWAEGYSYNLYVCPGGGRAPHPLLSMYVDPGVTPFVLACPEHRVGAESRMSGDAMRHPGWFPVRIVWRRPTQAEMTSASAEMLEHYRAGGLAREVIE